MWHWSVRVRNKRGRVLSFGSAESRDEATRQAGDAAYEHRYEADGPIVRNVYEMADDAPKQDS